jgi:hypothetical protein
LRTATSTELCRYLNVDKKTFVVWAALPGFPRPTPTPGYQRWLVADVLAFLRREAREVGDGQ